MRDQFADWQAAIGFAARLPGVDPASLRSGASPPPAATSSASRRALRSSWWRLRRHPTPTARPSRATRPRWRWRASPAGASSTPSAVWPAAAAGAPRRRAGEGRCPDDGGRPRRRPGAQPRQQVPGLAAGGRRLLHAPPRILPARPLRVPGAVPAAGPGVRPGSAALVGGPPSTRRSKDPAGSRSGYPAGTTSRS